MHDVERAAAECDGEVGADADGHAEPRATGDRQRGAERDQLGVVAARECAAPLGEVAGSVRRCEHGRHVSARTQLSG